MVVVVGGWCSLLLVVVAGVWLVVGWWLVGGWLTLHSFKFRVDWWLVGGLLDG